jgi:hypothetical protein
MGFRRDDRIQAKGDACRCERRAGEKRESAEREARAARAA